MQYYHITGKLRSFEIAEIERTIFTKLYKCKHCRSFAYKGAIDVNAISIDKNSFITFVSTIQLGVLSKKTLELFSEYNFVKNFYLGKVRLNGYEISDYFTYVPKEQPIGIYGDGTSILLDGCKFCGIPEHTFNSGHNNYVCKDLITESTVYCVFPGGFLVPEFLINLFPKSFLKSIFVKPVQLVDNQKIEEIKSLISENKINI